MKLFPNIITEKFKVFSSKQRVLGFFLIFLFLILFLPDTPVDKAGTTANHDVNVLSELPSTSKTDIAETENLTELSIPSPVLENEDTSYDNTAVSETAGEIKTNNNLHEVVKVVDGDTIDVLINGEIERIRMIGINTPETVDPRRPVECFGVEASNKAKELLQGKMVSLESDASQGDSDKYNRLLRYVFINGEINFNLAMIKQGYAYEYTYNLPYKYQAEFKTAQKLAESNKLGLWGDICQNSTSFDVKVATPQPIAVSTADDTACTIKGNINAKEEKIYHVVGCQSYAKTVIDESKDERWFCSESEAMASGWRKALNCH